MFGVDSHDLMSFDEEGWKFDDNPFDKVAIVRGDTSVRLRARAALRQAGFDPLNLERIAVACSSGIPLAVWF